LELIAVLFVLLVALLVVATALAVVHAKLEAALATGMIAREALTRAVDAEIAVRSMKESTHTMYPVELGAGKASLEEQISKLTGLGKEDFDQDLAAAGFDSAEDLV
jgi:biopolymer transport protein ExbD